MRSLILAMLLTCVACREAAQPVPPPAASHPLEKLAVLEFDVAPGVRIDRVHFSDKARGIIGDRAPALFVVSREDLESLVQTKPLPDCASERENGRREARAGVRQRARRAPRSTSGRRTRRRSGSHIDRWGTATPT